MLPLESVHLHCAVVYSQSLWDC